LLQAARCCFPDSAETSLCLLHADSLTTWAPTGARAVCLCLCSLGCLLTSVLPGCAGETHTVQLQAPLSPQELGTRHHPGLLWPTPLGLVLQRFTGGGPHGVQLHALLNPVDSTTRVDLPGVRLHWSSPTLPLVRAQPRVLLVVKQGHSQAGSSESQVVGCTSDTVQLLRVEQAPLDPGLPVGVQSRRLACACLWDGVLVRLDAVGWLGGVLR
jgi:hypothetical protein